MSDSHGFFADLRTYLLADSSISANIGTKLYDMLAPQGAVTPYVCWSTGDAGAQYAHDGDMGLDTYRVTFTILSPKPSKGLSIRDAIKDRISGFSGLMGTTQVASIFFENEFDQYLPETETKQIVMDFRVTLQGV